MDSTEISHLLGGVLPVSMTCPLCGWPSRDDTRCDRCQRWVETQDDDDLEDIAEYIREHDDRDDAEAFAA